jgi:proline iminopeptidase
MTFWLKLAVALIIPAIWFGSDKSTALPGQENKAAHETRVPVGQAELYARDVGKGPAILILHGGPDFDQSYMLPEMDRLADSYHLIYYDQRGRGKSADHVQPEEVTLASDIADIEKVRQYCNLDSVTLLGHSWGTVLALEYALKYPKRVSHLILMNPGPASTEDYVQLRNDWLEKRAELVAQKKAIAESAAYKEADPEAVTAYYRVHFKAALARQEEYEKLIARMHASFKKEGVLKARAIENRLMQDTWANPNFDLLPQIKSLKIPTLVLSGDHEFIPASSAEHIAQAIPNARLTILKGCGHFTFMECPVPVHEEIDIFFAGRNPATGRQ